MTTRDPNRKRDEHQRHYWIHREEALAANRHYYREHKEEWKARVKAYCDERPGYAAEKARNWRSKQKGNM